MANKDKMSPNVVDLVVFFCNVWQEGGTMWFVLLFEWPRILMAFVPKDEIVKRQSNRDVASGVMIHDA